MFRDFVIIKMESEKGQDGHLLKRGIIAYLEQETR